MGEPNKNNNPLVSIITVNFNQPEVTMELIESINNSLYKNIEILIVDNGSSTSRIRSLIKGHHKIILITSDRNLGFAGGNNLGASYSKGKYLFFINNDAEVGPDTIGNLVRALINDSDVGMVSPKIMYSHSPGIIQYAGSTGMSQFTLRNHHIGNKQKDEGQFDFAIDTPFGHGAAMMVPRTILKRVGVMTEDYFLYYEELDWCTRIKEGGFTIRFVPNATVYHKESISTGKNSPLKIYYLTRNRILYARKNLKGSRLYIALSYILFISVPRNTIYFLFNFKKLKAYYAALIWNVSGERIDFKPFNN